MALNKVNLTRLKSGEFTQRLDQDVIQYSDESGLYLHVREGDFAGNLAPHIKSSVINNDAGFYKVDSVPVRNATIREEGSSPGSADVYVDLSNQVLNLGKLAYTGEVLQRGEGSGAHIYNGAYAQHWVSTDTPDAHPLSGRDGDMWFVI